ncbi:hypothetical protein FHL15_007021 [Xylaria flabelliformis]|uniref:Uncharacterized protein n=1 Tax=Xylaria flabelliformis TaxID=2512241 RepID=A0A553HW19_9PEZI|nr:hypothetical protein FHL15_007021 [Xylaria flabelliformis]
MDPLAIYHLYREEVPDTSQSLSGGSEENNTQTSSGDAAANKEQNPSSASGQDKKIYFYKYRGRLISGEIAARLSPEDRISCIPLTEQPLEKPSGTKCDNEGSEKALGIKGTVCGGRTSFCSWDATIRHIDFHQCCECIIAMKFAPAA